MPQHTLGMLPAPVASSYAMASRYSTVRIPNCTSRLDRLNPIGNSYCRDLNNANSEGVFNHE
jgi:hypothetical protein